MVHGFELASRFQNRMIKLRIGIVATVLLFAAPASAETVDDRDRFQLWNNCEPVRLIVEDLPADAGKIGLRREDIQTAVRSRLRSARIFTPNPFATQYLYVNVSVVGSAFGIGVRLKRHVQLMRPIWEQREGSGRLSGIATTWIKDGLGTHDGDSGFILSNVARYIDTFIDDYFKVNADAC